jgi:hypothetical protein
MTTCALRPLGITALTQMLAGSLLVTRRSGHHELDPLGYARTRLDAADHVVTSVVAAHRSSPSRHRSFQRALTELFAARGCNVTADSRLGSRLSRRDQRIGTGPRGLARPHGLRIRPRVTAAAGRTMPLTDGATPEIDSLICATGYRTDHSWTDVPRVEGGVRTYRVHPWRHSVARATHARVHLAHPRLRATRLGWQTDNAPRPDRTHTFAGKRPTLAAVP